METYEEQCNKLTDLVRNGPGQDLKSLNKVKAILREVLANPWYNTYVSEKAGSVSEYFKMWFSARRWNRNDGGEMVKHLLHMAIAKLEGSCRSAFNAYQERSRGQ
jgi:hypothetical protein